MSFVIRTVAEGVPWHTHAGVSGLRSLAWLAPY